MESQKRQALVLIEGSEGQLAIGFFSLSLEWIDGNLGSLFSFKRTKGCCEGLNPIINAKGKCSIKNIKACEQGQWKGPQVDILLFRQLGDLRLYVPQCCLRGSYSSRGELEASQWETWEGPLSTLFLLGTMLNKYSKNVHACLVHLRKETSSLSHDICFGGIFWI